MWIWDVQQLSLVYVLKHQKPVQDFVWDPQHDKLLICTGSRRCVSARTLCCKCASGSYVARHWQLCCEQVSDWLEVQGTTMRGLHCATFLSTASSG